MANNNNYDHENINITVFRLFRDINVRNTQLYCIYIIILLSLLYTPVVFIVIIRLLVKNDKYYKSILCRSAQTFYLTYHSSIIYYQSVTKNRTIQTLQTLHRVLNTFILNKKAVNTTMKYYYQSWSEIL